ncbi:MAG: branched-chain-amino-acid transaminase [Rhodopirellula sp.]|nr:branched-chain-amino-acid transaminase [Rhodopirellula sp.]MCH2599526.1 branched-chain-amino-acid transaminase [Pirellulales bacterium]|tara:strand:- start:8680 stop:9537 length:858 start_codon:yes stop_codon:yes gene_type:complete
MALKVFINGTLYNKEDAKVSVYDHGFLYGDGVFEGMRSYGGSVFRMKEHLDRLWESAEKIQLEIPMSKEQMADSVNATLAANEIEDGYIRLVVSRGEGTLGLDPNKCPTPNIIIITDLITLYPDEFYQNGLEIITAKTIRNHPGALDPRIKSLNYLNNILAKIEGLAAGCVETLMLNHQGEVAECTGDNIFIVQDGRLLTPPVEAGVLEGITRGAVMELAAEDDVEVVETTMTLEDVYAAEEVFLTGSAAEIVPVIKVDGNQIGNGTPGLLTRRIADLYSQLRTS